MNALLHHDDTATLHCFSPENALATLHTWSDNGWLRQLDSAFPRFLKQLDAHISTEVLMASALLVHMEGRGHTCLPLATLREPHRLEIDWPPAARLAWSEYWRTWMPTRNDWLSALQASPLVRCPWFSPTAHNQDDQGQPLVLGGSIQEPLLYLRRYWVYEQQVAQAVGKRLQTQRAVDVSSARPWLDRLFPQATANSTDWQKIACAMALRSPLSVMTGGPGTGKTYTAARLLALLLAMSLKPESLRVALAAPTGKAAARLSQSIESSLGQLQALLQTTAATEADQIPDLAALTARIGKAKTVHSLLGASQHTRKFRHHAANPLDVDVLIVDETSMIHLEMMAALLQALPPHAQLILLGDKDQLASVEAGAVLGDLCMDAEAGNYSAATANYIAQVAGQHMAAEYCQAPQKPSSLAQQTVMLRHSYRFKGAIGALATAVNRGQVGFELLHSITQTTALPSRPTEGFSMTTEELGKVWIANMSHTSPALVAQMAVHGRNEAPGYRAYLTLAKTPPIDAYADEECHAAWVIAVLEQFERFRILCAVHDGIWGDHALNITVQKALEEAHLLQRTAGGEWFVGRPVMVTKNDAALGVFNGDVGVVLPTFSNPKRLRAYFLDGKTFRSVAISRLAHIETAFAMTVHKSQGSEFEHTLLVLPDSGGQIMNRQLVYTGITRARQYFSLIEAKAGTLALAARLPADRASGLTSSLRCVAP